MQFLSLVKSITKFHLDVENEFSSIQIGYFLSPLKNYTAHQSPKSQCKYFHRKISLVLIILHQEKTCHGSPTK